VIQSSNHAEIVLGGRRKKDYSTTEAHCPMIAPQHSEAIYLVKHPSDTMELWIAGFNSGYVLVKTPCALFLICFVTIRAKGNETLGWKSRCLDV
jgi:hypothetical protein